VSPWTVLQKAWNDSVWSKVIATAITAVLAAILAAVVGYWATLKEPREQITRFINAPMVVPAWLLVALGLLIIVLLIHSFRARRPASSDEEDIQPNAVLIAEARIMKSPVGKPFEELSEEQRTLLEGIFRRGGRGFDMPSAVVGQRWFEMLERYGYVKAASSPLYNGTTISFEITEAGWLELDRVLPSSR
jgi:hypothetical protein